MYIHFYPHHDPIACMFTLILVGIGVALIVNLLRDRK